MARADAEGLLQEGAAALAAADWDAARTSFEAVLALGPSPAAVDGLSEVANYERDYERAIALKEQAFAEYRQRGQAVEAAHAARWLGFLYGTYHGNWPAASGWMGRAADLLEGVEECAAHGWLALDRAPFADDPAEREQAATAALAIARRYGDADLEYEAVALLGEAYVAAGRISDGLPLLDQAMAAVAGGEVRDHKAIGEIYCRLLSGCEHAMDVRRAEEWLGTIESHVVWTDFARPTCRSHLGAILVALGRWQEAEAELVAAIETFERGYRGDRVLPLVRLADLRVRQGRFEEAERLLDDLEWHPTARRMAAEIALGRGDHPLAEELARLCVEGADPTDPACGPILEVLFAVQIARGDPAGAARTRDQLAALVDAGGARAEAAAELASGVLGARAGDAGARAHLTHALELYASLELPLEAARCRLELARALAADSPDAAAYEGRLALQAFERVGATRDADAAGEVMRGIGATGRAWPKGSTSLTKRETEVLALLGEGRTNAEIAERLFISVRTAEHHVANILGKLDLRNRGEAAAYAVRAAARKEP